MARPDSSRDASVSRQAEVYDEFADPMNRPVRPQPSWTSRVRSQFTEMPVFPMGIAAFTALAGFGIWRYRRMPDKSASAATLYFTQLRIAAQSLAVGIIAAGAVHQFFKSHWLHEEEDTKKYPNRAPT